MIGPILITLAFIFAVSTLIVLSLAIKAKPEPKLPPFTQAIIDQVKE